MMHGWGENANLAEVGNQSWIGDDLFPMFKSATSVSNKALHLKTKNYQVERLDGHLLWV
jgi:hypothetical protein